MFPQKGYPLKAGQIRRDKKELRSFLSRFAVVVPKNSSYLQVLPSEGLVSNQFLLQCK
jgi:hypothetical protein